MNWCAAKKPIAAIVGVALACAIGAQDAKPEAILTKANAEKHMQKLTSKEFAGRMTLTHGNDLAADYLVHEFSRFGLKPLETDFKFPFEASVAKKTGYDNLAIFQPKAGRGIKLKVGDDFVPLLNSSTNSAVTGSLVYAGEGVVKQGRNDYSNIDAKGKIVLILRSGKRDDGSPMTIADKSRAALAQGAIGLIVMGPQEIGLRELPNIRTAQGLANSASSLVGIGLHRKYANQLLGLSYEVLMRTPGPSRNLDFTATIRASFQPNKGTSNCVVGVLPGNDPKLKDEYIIFGAHFDHLGEGEVGSRSGSEKIHFGADDNASGSTALLLLAEHYAKLKSNRRTLIFQLYSGEEIGLVGSEAWAAAHPAILQKTTVMVNMDMVGRLRKEELSVFGSESSEEMPKLLDAVNVPGVKLVRSAMIPGNSDHASFTKRNVPAIAPFTGFHDEYHTENDLIGTINMEGIALVARAVSQFVDAADALPNKMTFRNAPVAAGSQGSQSGRGRRVRTGMRPSMTDSGPGLLIESVGAGSPAEKGGIKAGDRLVELNGSPINDIEDLQEVLVNLEPGKTVKAIVTRDGKRIELTITVEAAQGG